MEETQESFSLQEDDLDDSDRELQLAFQKGLLKPGLNIVQPVFKKTFINNVSGLKAKLIDVKKDLVWIERLDVTVTRNMEPSESADIKNTTEDDFRRECSFLSQAQSSVEIALQRLHKLKVPTKRPADYFAEMLKSDGQMKKVKHISPIVLTGFEMENSSRILSNDTIGFGNFMSSRLTYTEEMCNAFSARYVESANGPNKRKEETWSVGCQTDVSFASTVREKLLTLQTMKQRSEGAKRLREERKFAASVQKEVTLERQREKRELMDAVKKHKKGTKDRLNEVIEGRKNHKFSDKKRASKDSKYGFGGQKKRSKWNTAESAADYSSFSASTFSRSNREGGGRSNKTKRNPKKPQRPGKNRRAKMRSSKGGKKR